MAQVLIKNGIVVDPSQSLDGAYDLLIEEAEGRAQDGKIIAIDQPGKIPERASDGAPRRSVDAKGFWVVPGLIDLHVHFREPGHEYKETIETGSRAAVAGGFTSVACMANTHPVNDSPTVTAFIRERAKQNAVCRVFPIGALSKGLKGEELAEIGSMVAEGAIGISDDGMPVMNSYLMRKALLYADSFGVPVISHAEDANLVGQGVMNEGALSNSLGLRGNPAAAEEIMIARDVALARLTGAHVHIAHLSSALGLEHVRRAKEEGLRVTAEVSPHHLTLTEESLSTYDTHFKMAPPLRSERDVVALRKALAEGVIDFIASDHAPHGVVDKCVEFDLAACGIIGLQTSVPVTLSLFHSGVLTRSRWVEVLSTAAARSFHLPHGTLAVGSSADLTMIDPNAEAVVTVGDLRSKSANSPFLNQKRKGRVVQTWVGGVKVYG